MQLDSEGKRGRWIANIHEYDVDIKPTKLVKGQGLVMFLMEEKCEAMGISLEALNSDQPTPATMAIPEVHPRCFESPWYHDIIFYLHNVKCLTHLEWS